MEVSICVWLLLMAALLLSAVQPQKALFVTLASGILTIGRQSQNDILLYSVYLLVLLCTFQGVQVMQIGHFSEAAP